MVPFGLVLLPLLAPAAKRRSAVSLAGVLLIALALALWHDVRVGAGEYFDFSFPIGEATPETLREIRFGGSVRAPPMWNFSVVVRIDGPTGMHYRLHLRLYRQDTGALVASVDREVMAPLPEETLWAGVFPNCTNLRLDFWYEPWDGIPGSSWWWTVYPHMDSSKRAEIRIYFQGNYSAQLVPEPAPAPVYYGLEMSLLEPERVEEVLSEDFEGETLGSLEAKGWAFVDRPDYGVRLPLVENGVVCALDWTATASIPAETSPGAYRISVDYSQAAPYYSYYFGTFLGFFSPPVEQTFPLRYGVVGFINLYGLQIRDFYGSEGRTLVTLPVYKPSGTLTVEWFGNTVRAGVDGRWVTATSSYSTENMRAKPSLWVNNVLADNLRLVRFERPAVAFWRMENFRWDGEWWRAEFEMSLPADSLTEEQRARVLESRTVRVANLSVADVMLDNFWTEVGWIPEGVYVVERVRTVREPPLLIAAPPVRAARVILTEPLLLATICGGLLLLAAGFMLSRRG